MRVKRISVTGLFGLFDHEIPLTSAERVTIVHGPNGFGKTAMLRMIAALTEGRPTVFRHTPFTEFSLTLEDGSSRIIRRTTETQSDSDKGQVKLEFLVRDPAGHTSVLSPSRNLGDVPRHILDRIDRFVPGPYRRLRTGWIDSTGTPYSLEDIIEKFPRVASALPAKYRFRPFFDQDDVRVFFVEADRLGAQASTLKRPSFATSIYEHEQLLFERSRQRALLRVQQYSDDVVERIKSVLAAYAKHSQESDRTFPERLVRFARDRQSPLSERDILSKMEELERTRRRLTSLGFLDSESGLRDLHEEDVRRASEALTLYVGDVQQKLRVFDDMADRVGRLIDIINDRFAYKRLHIDREKGLVIMSDQGHNIQLEDLSSGEQHQLVVLYELLFRTPKNGLVLVDEPEISLHVAWQSRFLADLIGILELTDAYAVVATHSPVIIGTRWDLAMELKGPVSASTPSR